MARTGRPPKPTAIKLLEGNPGKRKIEQASLKVSAPPKRPKMTPAARDVWDELMEFMPPGVFTGVDTRLLKTYCELVALQDVAIQELEDGAGYTSLSARGGEGVSPWVRIQLDCAQKIATVGSRLGLDPAARNSIRAPDAPEEQSKFGGLIAGANAA